MSETPQETLEGWMRQNSGPAIHPLVREAIRAVLAESKTEQKFTNKYIKRLHAAEAEVERLRNGLRQRIGVKCSTCAMQIVGLPTPGYPHDEGCDRLRAEKAEAALREWIPPHSAACCMPYPGDGTFPSGPLTPNWCRCSEKVKRARAALRDTAEAKP